MRGTYDVVVSGGSVVGLVSYVVLRESGIDACCISGYSDEEVIISKSSRTVALLSGSCSLLGEIGCNLEGVGSWMSSLRVVDKLVDINFKANQMGESHLAKIVRIGEVVGRLWEIARERGYDRDIYKGRLKWLECDRDKSAVFLEGGEEVNCNLVVGADGGGSLVRRIGGIKVRESRYKEEAILYNCYHEEGHSGGGIEINSGGIGLTLVPLADKHRSSAIMVIPGKLVESCMDEKGEIGRITTSILSKWYGSCMVEGDIDRVVMGESKAERRYGERIVLVGDAGCQMLPYGAQGLNSGIQDSCELRRVLLEKRNNGVSDLGCREVVESYGNSRILDIEMRRYVGKVLYYIGRREEIWGKVLKNIGCNVVNSVFSRGSIMSWLGGKL